MGAHNTRAQPRRIRPFWGIVRARVGGPSVRTQRMIAEFGNYPISANIIYAQSAWSAGELRAATALCRRTSIPLIVNQNGWYYPGWFSGDWQQSNDELVKVQKAASLVVFQSRFCREAGKALTGFEPAHYEILYNAIPTMASMESPRSDGRTCWLSAVFTPDTRHIIEPALSALRLLRRGRDPRRAPRLMLAGHIPRATLQAPWFCEIKRELGDLEAQGACEWLGEYRPDDLPTLLACADVALHLKYKDPCPNAVIERMALGVPHVYSDSGGTPELVGEAGIPLAVEDTWQQQVPVDAEDLAQAIDTAFARRDELAAAAKERAKLFSWDRYVARHREIFARMLSDAA